ncbi:hypothetical protein LWC34_47910 [Kibdelosporangium philippinense]|uniref:Uncharacterized protein n=1 Tax=Kibdelosporangium philippinense TaxID=211113 RepID=A0ABS8ZSB3_9PSEU|nr:hypothetical protein [Kibdelosporangium philippinense]MCE7010479.1 hypothetical protein [Kibdelosporangium philippinense]
MHFNAEREVEDGTGRLRFLAYEDYLVWRDVWLRGSCPTARRIRVGVVGTGERNGVFADLLVCTGMRLREGPAFWSVRWGRWRRGVRPET